MSHNESITSVKLSLPSLKLTYADSVSESVMKCGICCLTFSFKCLLLHQNLAQNNCIPGLYTWLNPPSTWLNMLSKNLNTHPHQRQFMHHPMPDHTRLVTATVSNTTVWFTGFKTLIHSSRISDWPSKHMSNQSKMEKGFLLSMVSWYRCNSLVEPIAVLLWYSLVLNGPFQMQNGCKHLWAG